MGSGEATTLWHGLSWSTGRDVPFKGDDVSSWPAKYVLTYH